MAVAKATRRTRSGRAGEPISVCVCVSVLASLRPRHAEGRFAALREAAPLGSRRSKTVLCDPSTPATRPVDLRMRSNPSTSGGRCLRRSVGPPFRMHGSVPSATAARRAADHRRSARPLKPRCVTVYRGRCRLRSPGGRAIPPGIQRLCASSDRLTQVASSRDRGCGMGGKSRRGCIDLSAAALVSRTRRRAASPRCELDPTVRVAVTLARLLHWRADAPASGGQVARNNAYRSRNRIISRAAGNCLARAACACAA